MRLHTPNCWRFAVRVRRPFPFAASSRFSQGCVCATTHRKENTRCAASRLSTLPAGTAYSVPHGALLSFPLAPRPRLPLWQDLPELAEPSPSILVPDWPGASSVPLLPRREPTPEDMALIRRVVNTSRSQNEAITRLYGGKDGKTLAWVKMALEVPSITLTKE